MGLSKKNGQLLLWLSPHPLPPPEGGEITFLAVFCPFTGKKLHIKTSPAPLKGAGWGGGELLGQPLFFPGAPAPFRVYFSPATCVSH